ncbi:Acyl-CoA dehydrogenase family member 11, partial [Hondaea fermentalgiana]
EYIYPNEQLFAEQNKAMEHLPADQWTYAPILKELMAVAKKQGLWNLWLPNDTARLAGEGYEGAGLNNAQYAEICEIIGTSCHIEFAAECTNSSSPDTGNMETIARYGNEAQKKKWLKPLL